MKIQFDTDNSAFDEDNLAYEVHSILQKISTLVIEEKASGVIFDSKGNKIGSWSIDE